MNHLKIGAVGALVSCVGAAVFAGWAMQPTPKFEHPVADVVETPAKKVARPSPTFEVSPVVITASEVLAVKKTPTRGRRKVCEYRNDTRQYVYSREESHRVKGMGYSHCWWE